MFRALLNVYVVVLLWSEAGGLREQWEAVGDGEDGEEPVFRVVNGYPARLGDAPYQIALRVLVSGSLYKTFCGGALLAAGRLVSAAHCFQPFASTHRDKLGHIYAVAGSLRNADRYRAADSAAGGQWRRLRAVTYPAEYRFPEYDICVATTTEDFVFNKYVRAINFTRRAVGEHGGPCIVSGYGRVSDHSKDRSAVLLLAELAVSGGAECARLHRRDMARFLCTATIVSDVAKGDSGGPLVCRGTGDPREGPLGLLVGVVCGTAPVAVPPGPRAEPPRQLRPWRPRSHRFRSSFFTRVALYAPLLEGRLESRGPPRAAPPGPCLLLVLIHRALFPS